MWFVQEFPKIQQVMLNDDFVGNNLKHPKRVGARGLCQARTVISGLLCTKSEVER